MHPSMLFPTRWSMRHSGVSSWAVVGMVGVLQRQLSNILDVQSLAMSAVHTTCLGQEPEHCSSGCPCACCCCCAGSTDMARLTAVPRWTAGRVGDLQQTRQNDNTALLVPFVRPGVLLANGPACTTPGSNTFADTSQAGVLPGHTMCWAFSGLQMLLRATKCHAVFAGLPIGQLSATPCKRLACCDVRPAML